MHSLAHAAGFQHIRVVRITLCLIHRLQRAIQSRELRREPALLLVELLGVAARRLGADGGWVKHVDRRAQLVRVTVGLLITRGAAVGAEKEAAEEWLHSHDAGAYDARVCLD